MPTYGSGIILETRTDHTGEAYVSAFYANVTNNVDIQQLELNKLERFSAHCKQAHCSVADFERSLQAQLMTPEELERRCTQG